MLKRTAKKFLASRGYRLINYPAQRIYDVANSGPLDSPCKDLLFHDLFNVAKTSLPYFGNNCVDSLSDIVREFLDMFGKRPFAENVGGSLFHNSFWLYLAARLLEPKIVVESGVWRGQTTWLFREARKDAEIFGFDVNLANLEVDESIATFVNADWSTFDVSPLTTDRDFVFFDDHIDQSRRILEAAERGFKLLIFDDNFPIQYSYIDGGYPAFPTADMVYKEQYLEQFSFQSNGQRFDCRIENAQREAMELAKKKIKDYFVFPDVGGMTRFGGFAYLTLIRLK